MKILGIKKETGFTHVNLFSVTYQDKAERTRSWVFASRKKEPTDAKKVTTPDAVVIVPYHVDEKKLVMIREFRIPLGGFQYGFPAGLVDGQETVEATATRELREETGLTTLRIIKQSPIVFSSSGLTDESLSLVFVECAGLPSTRGTSDAEEIEVVLMSQADARRIKESREACFDVKSWLVLATFSETGSI